MTVNQNVNKKNSHIKSRKSIFNLYVLTLTF
jgi:hypothetical protein